jgi:hypothetical protein
MTLDARREENTMENFVRSQKATLVALAVFVVLAWLIGRPFGQAVYHGVTERACSATETGYVRSLD